MVMFRLKTKITVVSTALIIGLVFLRSLAFAAINEQISFQGKLANSSGVSVADGNYDLVFNLYTVSTGGTAIWTGTYTTANGNPVSVEDGIFAIMLGSGTGNSLSSVNFNQTLYLGITVSTDTEMTPRKTIGAVPQSFVSKYLETASGSGAPAGTGADDVLLLDGSGNINISGDVIAGGLTIDTDTLYVDSVNHRVGIGTTSPESKMEISESTADGSTGLQITETSGAVDKKWKLQVIGSNVTDRAGNFEISESGTGDWFAIAPGGNIGIGTTKPSYGRLEISRDVTATNYDLGLSQLIVQGATDTTRELHIGYETENDYAFIDALDRGDTWAKNLVLNGHGGNVGIGTTTPHFSLTVRSATATHIQLENSADSVATRIVQTNDSLLLDVNRDTITGVFDDVNQAHARITIRSANADSSVQFYTKDANNVHATERVVINKAGNVGIGTTSPSRLLHIDGAMRLETTSTPSSPASGDIYSDGTDLFYHNGTGWDDLTAVGLNYVFFYATLIRGVP